MIFPSGKKKELLRYASKNSLAMRESPCSNQQLQQPQQQQEQQQQQQRMVQMQAQLELEIEQSFQLVTNTPPPPYTTMPAEYTTRNSIETEPESETVNKSRIKELMCEETTGATTTTERNLKRRATAAVPLTPPVSLKYTKDGFVFENPGHEVCDECMNNLDQTAVAAAATTSSATTTTMPKTRQQRSTITHFATTAVNIFRNCCGRRLFPATAATAALNRQRNAKTSSSSSLKITTLPPTVTESRCCLVKEFNALMKLFRHKQMNDLLKAIRVRVDPTMQLPNSSTAATAAAIATAAASSKFGYLRCILVKRIAGQCEENYVTVCRMFFWCDLQNAYELKRLPSCTSDECDRGRNCDGNRDGNGDGDRDQKHECCNPLHYYRIISIEHCCSIPAYRQAKMLKLDIFNESSSTATEEADGGDIKSLSFTCGTNTNAAANGTNQSSYYSAIPESLTTEGKDATFENNWCQIAYWEFKERIGPMCAPRTKPVNIYYDGIPNDIGENICIRELCRQQRIRADAAQQHTRQKIGLGIEITLDSNGSIWVYNRANVPIFVDSPLLSSITDRVWKIMPGYCMKTYDMRRTYQCASMDCCKHQRGMRTIGPIDRFSMKISFAKGWGNAYKRQDIASCPCWLEVHFPRRR